MPYDPSALNATLGPVPFDTSDDDSADGGGALSAADNGGDDEGGTDQTGMLALGAASGALPTGPMSLSGYMDLAKRTQDTIATQRQGALDALNSAFAPALSYYGTPRTVGDPNLMLAQALLSPTRTRGLSGVLGNVVGALNTSAAAQQQADEARKQQLAQLQLQQGLKSQAIGQAYDILAAKYGQDAADKWLAAQEKTQAAADKAAAAKDSQVFTGTGAELMKTHPGVTVPDPNAVYNYTAKTGARPLGTAPGQIPTIPGLTNADYALPPDEFLKKMESVNLPLANRIKDIATYQTPPGSMRGALGEAELAAVHVLNPAFDQTQYGMRQQTYKQFANSSKSALGGQILSGNVALQHLNDWYTNTAALNQDSNLVPINAVKNALRANASDPTYLAANTAAKNVAGEIAQGIMGHVTDQSIRDAQAGISVNLSAKGAQAAARTNAELILQRLVEQANQWSAKTGEAVNPGHFLNPSALKAIQHIDPTLLDKYGIDPNANAGVLTSKVRSALGIAGSALPIPSRMSDLVTGAIYATPKGGNMRWTGSGWEQP